MAGRAIVAISGKRVRSISFITVQLKVMQELLYSFSIWTRDTANSVYLVLAPAGERRLASVQSFPADNATYIFLRMEA